MDPIKNIWEFLEHIICYLRQRLVSIEETHSKMVYAFFLVRITSPDGVLSRLKWLKCPTNNQASIPKNV